MLNQTAENRGDHQCLFGNTQFSHLHDDMPYRFRPDGERFQTGLSVYFRINIDSPNRDQFIMAFLIFCAFDPFG